jgi:ribosomal protein L29
MKRKDFNDIKQKPTAELAHELQKIEDRYRVLKNDIATGKVKSLKEMHTIRKSVAQLKTVLHGREIEAAKK